MRLPVILEVNKTSKLKFQISDDLDLGIYEVGMTDSGEVPYSL